MNTTIDSSLDDDNTGRVKGVTPCIVYGVRSPDGGIHYVGQTTQSLMEREYGHRETAHPYGSNFSRYLWACEIAEVKLEFLVLDASAVWCTTEMETIERLYKQGEPLLNMTAPRSINKIIKSMADGPKKRLSQDHRRAIPINMNMRIDEALHRIGRKSVVLQRFCKLYELEYVKDLFDLTEGQLTRTPHFGPAFYSDLQKIMTKAKKALTVEETHPEIMAIVNKEPT